MQKVWSDWRHGKYRRLPLDERRRPIPKNLISTRPKPERALLVGVQLKRNADLWSIEDSLDELAELARSAGAVVVDRMVQRIEKPTHVYVGKGKLEELQERVKDQRISTVITDDELTPTQQRNLENALSGIKVIDRTALILDVFAHRARTKEGRLQVELAQHEYLMPRLAGQWSHLERLGGGIGTRGPGETQIETDRRLVRRRIQTLKKNLEDVRRHRAQYRSRRKTSQIPVASLVGYTNAGKSTLLNALTGAGVEAENRLFSTLDTVTRRIALPSGRDLLLSDTVGFINKLPTTLVAAFRATLEEAEESDMLLHVLDVMHPNAVEQAEVVDDILDELGLSEKPRILVLNKIDKLERGNGTHPESGTLEDLAYSQDRVVFVSAVTGEGLDTLRAEIESVLNEVALDTGETLEQFRMAADG